MGPITVAVVGGVLTGVVGAVMTKILIPAGSRKLEYCRNLEENMETLRKGVKWLNQQKADVELEKQKRKRGKMVKNEVEHWLSCVKKINEEVQDIEKSCSAGSGGRRTKARLGKNVLRKIDEVIELRRQQGNFSGDIWIDIPST